MARPHQMKKTGRLNPRKRCTRTGCRKLIGRKVRMPAKTTTAKDTHSPGSMTNSVNTTMFQTTGNPLKKFSFVFMPVSA